MEKSKKLIKKILIIILALIASSNLLYSEETFRIGAFNYYPAIFQDKDGEIKGFYVDAFKEIEEKENIRFEYVFGTWNEGLERIKSGEIDVMVSVAYTEDRSLYMDYCSTPLLTVWGEVYVLQSSPIDGILDLENKTIAVMKSDANGEQLKFLTEKLSINCTYIVKKDFQQVFESILSKEVDAGVVNSTFGTGQSEKYDLRSSGIVFNPFDIFITVRKNENGKILQLFEKYLNDWKYDKNSVYNTARKKWSYGKVGEIHIIPGWLKYALFTIIGISIVLAVFILLLRHQVKKATDKVKSSEAIKNAMVSNIEDVIVIIDQNGVNQYKSQNVTKLFGWKPEELVGKSTWDNVHPDNLEAAKKFFNEIAKLNNARGTTELQYKQKNGSYVWIEITLVNLLNDKNIQGILGNYHPITERKRFESELIKAKDKAENNEKKYRLLAENVSDGIILIENNKIEYVSPGYAKLISRSSKFLRNIQLENIFSYIHPDDRERIKNEINQAHKKQLKHYSYEYRAQKGNSEYIWIEDSLNSEYDKDGNRVRTIIRARDITKLKNTESELKNSLNRFSALVEHLQAGVFYANTKGEILELNPAMLEILGSPSKEITKSINLFEFQPLIDIGYSGKLKECINTRKIVAGEARYTSKWGKEAIVVYYFVPIIENNVVVGVLASNEDYTEKRKAEQIIKESEQRLKLASKSAELGIWDWNVKENIMTWDERMYELYGINEETFVETVDAWMKGLHPDDKDRAIAECNDALKGIHDFNTTFRVQHPDGKVLYIKADGLVLRDSKGEATRMIGINRDVTESRLKEIELKKAKEEAEDLKERFDYATSIGQVGTWDWNLLTDELIWSNHTYRILGHEPGSVKPSYELFLNIVHPDDREFLDANVKAAWNEKKPYSVDCRILIDNKIRICNATGKVEYNKKDKPVRMIGTFQDITERKKIENELIKAKEKAEESELKYRTIFESAPVGIFRSTKEGKFIEVNQSLANILGYDSPKDVIDNIHNISEQIYVRSEKRTEIVTEISSQKVLKTENIYKRKNGEHFYANLFLRELKDEKGQAILEGIVEDISDRKKYEQELHIAKEKAEEANKLKTEFLNNMSHEIRTPMNGIIGFSKLLDKPDLSDDKRKYYTRIVQNSSHQLLKIIDDILEISTLETKQEKINEDEFCLNDFLMELFAIFNLKSKERNIPIYLRKALHDEQSHIVSDKTKLNKILSNLLSNALKFTDDGSIEFGYRVEKANLIFYVKDTGIGISPKNHQIIFERFSQEEKTLSRKYGGLGLGLSISKENAQLLGGDITLESEKGKGSTFFVTIPYKPVQNENNSKSEDKSPNLSTDNSYTILVAEDEEVNYLYIEALFEEVTSGKYNLIHAKNGKEAVDICDQNKNIDLVLMDIKMPVMNGHEASKKIKAKFPDLPIIAQTAYSTLADKEHALKSGCDDFVSKPIDTEKLFELIDKFLHKTMYRKNQDS